MATPALNKDQLKEGLKGFGPLWHTRVVRMNSSGEMIINCDLVLPRQHAVALRDLYLHAGVKLPITRNEAHYDILERELNDGDARLVQTHRYITELATAKTDKPLKEDTQRKLLEEANRKMEGVIGHDLGALPKLTAVEDCAVVKGAARGAG